MITAQQKKIIQQILAPFEPTQIGIFGSHARGTASVESDLDILVQFRKKYSLFDLLDLEEKLGDALSLKIDLVTEPSLHPAIKKFVQQDLIILE